jgi:arsenite methyltransferase
LPAGDYNVYTLQLSPHKGRHALTQYLQHKNDPAEIAEVFDEVTFWASRFGALLFDNLQLRHDLGILDVGCATGFPLFELAQAHGPSCRATGIDIWRETLPRAQARKRVYPQENVSIVGADAASMPFPAATFDLIVSNLGINNFADPEAVMAECSRVAKPGARLVLTTNLTGHMREFYDAYRRTLATLGLSHRLDRLHAQESHRGTLDSVRTLVESAGFEPTKIIESSFKLRFLNSAAFFNHHLVKIGFLDGWRGVLAPGEESRVFHALEEALDSIASDQGELHMTIPMLYLEAEKG